MARRPTHQRKENDYKPGRVDLWGTHAPPAHELAESVRYVGSGKHKNYPSPHGEWIPIHRPGTARCAHFVESEWPRLLEALRLAICNSCVQFEPGKPFPTRVWAYINDKLHEAKITNQGTGEYHGIPLEYESQMPDDPHDLLRNAPRVYIEAVD
jgi:hypothetical protein